MYGLIDCCDFVVRDMVCVLCCLFGAFKTLILCVLIWFIPYILIKKHYNFFFVFTFSYYNDS